MKILIAILSFHFAIQTAYAQERNESSFTIGLGYGPAFGNRVCEPCLEKNEIMGYSFMATVGVRVNEKFLIDITPHIWNSNERKDPANSRVSFLIRTFYFPFHKSRFTIFGGGGFGRYMFTPKTAIVLPSNRKTLGSIHATGPVLTMGVGNEFYITNSISITPTVGVYVLFPGDLTVYNLENDVIKNDRKSIIGEVLFTFRYYPSF